VVHVSLRQVDDETGAITRHVWCAPLGETGIVNRIDVRVIAAPGQRPGVLDPSVAQPSRTVGEELGRVATVSRVVIEELPVRSQAPALLELKTKDTLVDQMGRAAAEARGVPGLEGDIRKRADVADVVQELDGQDRQAKLVKLLPDGKVLIDAQGVNDVEGAIQIGLAPDDLLIADARGKLTRANLPVLQIEVEIAEFFLGSEEV